MLEPGSASATRRCSPGCRPRSRVRAREPSSCALFPRRAARRVLATEAGRGLRGRSRAQAPHPRRAYVHGLHDVGTTPVSAIMRAPVVREPGGASALAARGSAGRRLPGAAGRARRRDRRHPHRRRGPRRRGRRRGLAPRARPRLRPRAGADGARRAARHPGDRRHAGGRGGAHGRARRRPRLRGALGRRPLGLDANSPIGLRHTILGAADADVLVRAVSHLPQLFLTLTRAGVPSRDLGGCSASPTTPWWRG